LNGRDVQTRLAWYYMEEALRGGSHQDPWTRSRHYVQSFLEATQIRLIACPEPPISTIPDTEQSTFIEAHLIKYCLLLFPCFD